MKKLDQRALTAAVGSGREVTTTQQRQPAVGLVKQITDDVLPRLSASYPASATRWASSPALVAEEYAKELFIEGITPRVLREAVSQACHAAVNRIYAPTPAELRGLVLVAMGYPSEDDAWIELLAARKAIGDEHRWSHDAVYWMYVDHGYEIGRLDEYAARRQFSEVYRKRINQALDHSLPLRPKLLEHRHKAIADGYRPSIKARALVDRLKRAHAVGEANTQGRV